MIKRSILAEIREKRRKDKDNKQAHSNLSELLQQHFADSLRIGNSFSKNYIEFILNTEIENDPIYIYSDEQNHLYHFELENNGMMIHTFFQYKKHETQ